MTAMPATAWTDTEPDDAGHPTDPPDALAYLLEHLTDHGKGLFFRELEQAAGGARRGHPDAVSRVFERWWRSLIVQQDPDFAQNMARSGTLTGHQTAAELQAEVEALIAEGPVQ